MVHDGSSTTRNFSSTLNKVYSFLNLLHFDLEGPLPRTFRGYKYFLLVKDDATELMFLKPLCSKGEVFDKLLQLKTFLELQSGKRWRRGRSDGGREFNSTKSIQWFKDNRVFWEPSGLYTPQQNGKAERSMHIIMRAIWSVMAKKQLPKSLWHEITADVVHVRNKCSIVEGKTPFQQCNNQLPDVSNLRVLGCRAWVLVPDIKSRLTMDLRTWQGIMVGYEANNQWRIYNHINTKVHISRDVRFDEGYAYDSKLNEHNKKVREF